MKYFLTSALLGLSAVSAIVIPTQQEQVNALSGSSSSSDSFTAQDAGSEKRLVQLAPMEMKWITEDEKLELIRQRKTFMDITDHQHLGFQNAIRTASNPRGSKVQFPPRPQFQSDVTPLLENLIQTNMEENLQKFTTFHTRYYNSDYGRQSSEWLLSRINATAAHLLPSIDLRPFPHSWPQSSIIATIPGKTSKTVVIGAHQDSMNLFLPSFLAAPGADDDGSGTVTILEAFRVLVQYLADSGVTLENTVEFMWFSAEEGGLLGSQDIFSYYEREDREVVAMLQQDMTGFVQKTLDGGRPESVGVITDYVDEDLTEFIKEVVTEYCDIPYVLTKCGYACSDHASASKAGYPSAFVIESLFTDSDYHIHTAEDKIKYLSFEHMLQHAKLTLGFAYELGNADFGGDKKKAYNSEL